MPKDIESSSFSKLFKMECSAYSFHYNLLASTKSLGLLSFGKNIQVMSCIH